MDAFNDIKATLMEEHFGFSGITHWLIAIFLFFCMWLMPIPFAQDYISAITQSKIFAIIIFFVIGGASLLPDLDSSPLQEGGSTAVYQLGFLGNLLSVVAITISGVVYSILHTKYDDKPKSQHRMLFHAPIIPILLYLWVIICIPSTSDRLMDHRDLEHFSMFVLVFFAGASVYLGASMIIYKILKLIGRQSTTQFICLVIMIFSIWNFLTMPYSQLKLVGIAIALGYIFHIIADCFSKGSAPIFFPIPTPVGGLMSKKFKLWRKPYLLGNSNFAITTGGTINIILNFVMFGVDIFFAYFLFFA